MKPTELPPGLGEMAPGPRLSAALATVDPTRLTAHQLVVLVAARGRQIAQEQAQQLVALRELGHAPPAERERVVRDPERGGFATVEAAFGATWTVYRCELQMRLAEFAFDEVPELGQAFLAGRVDVEKVKVFERALSLVTDRAAARQIVAAALRSAQRDNTATLRARLQRLLAQHDPESVRQRRERDHDDRFVGRYPGPAGLVDLVARFADPTLTTAAYENLTAIATATKAAGDPTGRTMDQLRHDAMLNLLTGTDPATAGLATPVPRRSAIVLKVSLATLVGIRGLLGPAGLAGLTSSRRPMQGSDDLRGEIRPTSSPDEPGEPGEPGEIAGYGPVSAHIARGVAAQLAQASVWRYAVDHDGRVIAEGMLPKRLVPGLIRQMSRWAVDATAGPDGRAHRQPTAAQVAFVRARDGSCQAPGCRVPAHRCQIDHRLPWHRGGPTIVDNLFCLCRRHHRAKDVGGHGYQPIHGGIEWTTAAGHRYRSRPDTIQEHPYRRGRAPTVVNCTRLGITIDVALSGHRPVRG